MSGTAVGVSREHITKTPGVCGGKACIAGHRIRVLDVALWYDRGTTPEEILHQYPSITLADVHAAIAYYLDHRDEIAADLRRSEEVADKYRHLWPNQLKDRAGD